MTTATVTSAHTEAIAQHIEQAFPFEIVKLPLRGPDGLATPHYGLFRSDNSECIGAAVRTGYQPHTREDLQALAEAAAVGFSADAAPRIHCAWRDGHYFTMEAGDDLRRDITGRGDNIHPRFIVHAGYDSRAFTATLGFYRDRCRNLAMLSDVQQTTYVIRHTNGLREKMGELAERFRLLADSWPAVIGACQEMHRRDVSIPEFLGQVFPRPERITRRQDDAWNRRIGEIITRIERERTEEGRGGSLLAGTAWEAFNAVQGWSQHQRRRLGQPSPFERAIRAFDDPAVSRALQLALAT